MSTEREPTDIGEGAGSGLPPTERRLDASRHLDQADTLERLRLLNAEDERAVAAVRAVLPQLAEIVDRAVDAVRSGGSVHYFGAGTPGRLGMLDAAELRPTFQLEDGVVTAHLAGGADAMLSAVEGAEDSAEQGAEAAGALGPHDIAIGIAASGSTPYVGGALREARSRGALTVLVSSNRAAPLAELADHHLLLDTGAEVVTGSTRLKAGTAQKLLLNGFSTALMVALGRTWSNLMVAVVPSNAKLRERQVRILREATGLEDAAARSALAASGNELRTALVAELAGTPVAAAREALADASGSVAAALDAVGVEGHPEGRGSGGRASDGPTPGPR